MQKGHFFMTLLTIQPGAAQHFVPCLPAWQSQFKNGFASILVNLVNRAVGLGCQCSRFFPGFIEIVSRFKIWCHAISHDYANHTD